MEVWGTNGKAPVAMLWVTESRVQWNAQGSTLSMASAEQVSEAPLSSQCMDCTVEKVLKNHQKLMDSYIWGRL